MLCSQGFIKLKISFKEYLAAITTQAIIPHMNFPSAIFTGFPRHRRKIKNRNSTIKREFESFSSPKFVGFLFIVLCIENTES
jgi:hypothetical protein